MNAARIPRKQRMAQDNPSPDGPDLRQGVPLAELTDEQLDTSLAGQLYQLRIGEIRPNRHSICQV